MSASSAAKSSGSASGRRRSPAVRTVSRLLLASCTFLPGPALALAQPVANPGQAVVTVEPPAPSPSAPAREGITGYGV